MSAGLSTSKRLRHTSILTATRCPVASSAATRHRQLSMSSMEVPMSSRLQLALNVNDIDEAVAFYSALFGTELSQAPARLRELRRRRAAAQAGPAREPWPGRQPQPPRRRGRRRRHGRRRAGTPRPGRARPGRRAARPPAATPSRTSSGSRAHPTANRWEIYTVLADSQTFYAEGHGPECCGDTNVHAGEPGAIPEAATCC